MKIKMNKRYIPNIDNFLINLTIHPKFQLQFNNKYIYIECEINQFKDKGLE